MVEAKIISTGGPSAAARVESAALEATPSFESYMARYENKNIYFSKLMEYATNGRASMQLRGKAINMAIARAKQLKKIG